MLFPPAVEDFIPDPHPVRVVNDVIERVDLSALYAKYGGGGRSSYHPKMLLKVLVFGYLSNIYSSRKLEAAVCEHVHFMWLADMQRPDHNTINRFRGDRLKGIIKPIFAKVVELLVQSGHVSLKQAYTDGTKIEANANRYTFVWAKSIRTNKEKMAQQLEELWEYAESVAAEELKDKRPSSFEPTDKEQVERTIEAINSALSKKKVPAKVKQKLNYAKKNWPDKVEEYQEKEGVLEDRGSFSKTDNDATFMRMKEDHMRNGQLKPGYNLQISTSNQYILHYSLHQTTTDTTTLTGHLKEFKELYGLLPEELTADAGYGSEENYHYLEENGVESYVKYNTFDKSRKRSKWEERHPFAVERLHHHAGQDCFYCPMGQKMGFIGEFTQTTKTGFEQQIRKYQAQNCKGCPLHTRCHKSKGNRIVQVNFRLRRYREEAKMRLEGEKGIAHRKQRPHDVEPVFGQIKHNRGFRRYLLRGIEKVEVESGLLAIAHNLKKSAKEPPLHKAS